MHRSYMRRGVSLEVIVEEDDNAEVSLDPRRPFHDSTGSSSSSPTLSGESDVENKSSTSSASCSSSSSTTTTKEFEDGSGKESPNDDDEDEKDSSDHYYRLNQTTAAAANRLRQEKEKRRKQKEEKCRFSERQRSLSCETLTILDVGDDEFSREQWEVETRDWDSENPNKNSEIEHSISRKKILASRLGEQQELHYDGKPESSPPARRRTDDDEAESERETHVDEDADGDDENETDNDYEDDLKSGRYWWNTGGKGGKNTCNITADSSEYKADDKSSSEIRTDAALLNGDHDQDSLEDETLGIETFSSDNDDESEKREEEINCDIEINQNYRKFDEVNNNSTHNYSSSENSNMQITPFSNKEDSWITVGELIDGTEEKEHSNEVEEDKTNDLGEESPKNIRKEVRFSDRLEFLNETSQTINISEIKESDIIDIPEETKQTETTVETPTNINHEKENNKESEVILEHNLVSVKDGKSLFERRYYKDKIVPPLVEKLTSILETPDIMIIEKDEDPEVSQTENDIGLTLEQDESTLQRHNKHNTEIRPEEFPPPKTVASVRKLFEQVPTLTVCNVRQYKQLTRFDHVRSNPTSKILRFDRHDSNHSTGLFLERNKPSSSTTNPQKMKPSSQSSTLPSSILPQIPKEIKNIFPTCEEIREETRRRSQKWLPPKLPSEDFSATGVPLRKPQVANGFNVQKALRENPRYFHIRVDEKGKLIKGEELKKPTSNHQQKQKSNSERGSRRSTITYSYLEAKHQRHTGNTTSLRWTKESVDRSDSESMSSESSEDSGVSRDFTSTIISSFASSAKKKNFKIKGPNAIPEEYGSDPSFKWIDPTILAKIRARGTTVIYFGPRPRPQGQANNRTRSVRRKSPDCKLPSFDEEDLQPNDSSTSWDTSSNVTFSNKITIGKSNLETLHENVIGGEKLANVTHIQTGSSSHLGNKSNTKSDQATSRPKIVGVMHKKAADVVSGPVTIEPISSDTTTCSSNNNNNSTKMRDEDEGQQQYQPKPFLHTDSRIIHMRELKKKSSAANSVIYDFTEKQA